jgi:hypothetical protein
METRGTKPRLKLKMDKRAHNSGERLVKVRFPVNSRDWKGLKSESVWAAPVGRDTYSIRNSPFYVYGVSAGDVVHARTKKGVLAFDKVAKRGGHSTYRILLHPHTTIGNTRFRKYWQPLQELGCTYELAKTTWLAVDVPPEADIYNVYSLLEMGEAEDVWEFEEAHCGHPVAK